MCHSGDANGNMYISDAGRTGAEQHTTGIR